MGCSNNCIDSQHKLKKYSKEQIDELIDLDYSRKILYLCLSSLKAIGIKNSFIPVSLRLIPNSIIDCSSKDLEQLRRQLKIMVMLFGFSRQRLELNQKFTYSAELSERYINQIIDEYKAYFRQSDQHVFQELSTLQNIMKGIYSNQLQSQLGSHQIQNPQSNVNRKILKQGIEATLIKDEIQKNFREKYKSHEVSTEKLS